MAPAPSKLNPIEARTAIAMALAKFSVHEDKFVVVSKSEFFKIKMWAEKHLISTDLNVEDLLTPKNAKDKFKIPYASAIVLLKYSPNSDMTKMVTEKKTVTIKQDGKEVETDELFPWPVETCDAKFRLEFAMQDHYIKCSKKQFYCWHCDEEWTNYTAFQGHRDWRNHGKGYCNYNEHHLKSCDIEGCQFMGYSSNFITHMKTKHLAIHTARELVKKAQQEAAEQARIANLPRATIALPEEPEEAYLQHCADVLSVMFKNKPGPWIKKINGQHLDFHKMISQSLKFKALYDVSTST